jgi:hypothetical protein
LNGFKKLKDAGLRESRYLSEPGIKKLLSLADPFMQKAIKILLYTSVRRSEHIYLTWEDQRETKLSDNAVASASNESLPVRTPHPVIYKLSLRSLQFTTNSLSENAIPHPGKVQRVPMDVP